MGPHAPHRTRITAALALLAAVATGACTGEAETPVPSGTPDAPTETLDCTAVIDEVDTLGESYEIFADAVALHVDPSALTLPAGGGQAGAYGFFVKTGLLVRPGVAASIRVDPSPTSTAGQVAMAWGNADATVPAPVFTIPSCPVPTDNAPAWLVFAGGFYVNEASCVPLIIRSGTMTMTARIPIGTQCS